MIVCDICAASFDSQDSNCRKCEDYNEGLGKYGHTKSNEEYQLEMLKKQMELLK